ncbi:MAG: HAMP domain-containing protein [Gammaproteobacteria bacterium]|nr:HAMP domain-containing protein [Gammaproteobacteria bacterium]
MHSLSLKFRITALALLVAVVPFALFQIITVKRSSVTLLNFLGNDLEEQSLIIAREINRFLSQRLTDARLIAKANVFKQMDADVAREYLRSVAQESEPLYAIDLANTKGIILISSSNEGEEGYIAWDLHLGVKNIFQQAVKAREGDVFISEAYLLGTGPELILATPFTDAGRKKVAGVLLVEISLQGVQEIINDFSERNITDTHTYIVDKFGNVIVTTNNSMPVFERFPDLRIQPAMLSDTAVGSVGYVNSESKEVMAGFADMREFGVNRGLDWNVITVTPKHQVTQPIDETRNVLTAVGIIFSTIAVLVAYLLARSITLPLQRTVNLAEEIRKGNYSHRLEENIGGEIGSLATAINEMADRIEERTAEIVTRNEKLTSEIVERKIAQDRLKKLSHKIVRLQEEERRRVSRELHDGINQLLVSVKYKIENFDEKFAYSQEEASKDINKAVIFLDEAISEVRRVSHALRPSVLDDLGLAPAITNLSRQFSERNQIDVQVGGVDGENPKRMPMDVETAMYRIVQEALTNIEKHANASTVVINVTHNDTNVTIRLEDDGQGFDLQKATRTSQSMGLRNMRERIELLQGSFFIHSDVGKGTFLEVKAPLSLD